MNNTISRCIRRITVKIGNIRTSTSYQQLKIDEKNDKGIVGWLLLAVPVTTFGLGTWQVKRKIWKENLIEELSNKSKSDPVPLIEHLDNLNELEYKPVYARGRFLHEHELHMGPRSFVSPREHGDNNSGGGGIFSKSGTSTQGYLIITPFKLTGVDKTILVNRGWVPVTKKNPEKRMEGQVETDVDIVGIVRNHENRPTFLPKNNPGSNQWFYRDVHRMAQLSGAEPIYLDLTNDFDIKGGPIGGQTRVNLRNEHLSYILTWYGLSLATAAMWYVKFIKK